VSGAPVRLQKYLSQAGVASRRAAEALISAGRVRVDGRTVTELGTKVEPGRSRVEVDGRLVEPAPTAWIAFNKPRGVLSTRRDPHGGPTIYDVLGPEHAGLFYVGRLDRDSEGLLLLTNDGDAAHRLLHPRFSIERIYEVGTTRRVTREERAALLDGVELEDGVAQAKRVRTLPARGGLAVTELVLLEGRKREVRRIFAALGLDVVRLRRTQYGPIRLGTLRTGAWRALTTAEIAALASGARH
jgi:23S rRNA pseudouridine2605 synthase